MFDHHRIRIKKIIIANRWPSSLKGDHWHRKRGIKSQKDVEPHQRQQDPSAVKQCVLSCSQEHVAQEYFYFQKNVNPNALLLKSLMLNQPGRRSCRRIRIWGQGGSRRWPGRWSSSPAPSSCIPSDFPGKYVDVSLTANMNTSQVALLENISIILLPNS